MNLFSCSKFKSILLFLIIAAVSSSSCIIKYPWEVPPKAPTDLVATDGTYSDKVSLTWAASATAESYTVYRATEANPDPVAIKSGITVLTYDDTTVVATNPPVVYTYTVTAVNKYGESPASNSDTGYALQQNPVPGQVQNVQASDGTLKDGITVTWDALAGDVTGYRVYRSATANGDYTQVIELASTDTTTLVDGVAGELVWIKVSALNTFGEGPLSDPNVGHAMGVPVAPTGLTATQGTLDNAIKVDWQAVTGGEGTVIGYDVYGSDAAAGPFVKLTSSPIAELTFTESGLEEGKVRYYRVSATNEVGEGAQSDAVPGMAYKPCVPPAAPTNVEASKGSVANAIVVSWTGNADATSYTVARANTVDGPFVDLVTTDATTITDTENIADNDGIHFFYQVTAINSCGSSVVSTPPAEGWSQGLAPVPTGVVATDGTIVRQILVTWASSEGAVSYNVYRSSTNAEGSFTQIGSATTTSYADDTVANGQHFFYSVSAVNAAGESALSASDEGSAMPAPDVPQNVQASDGASTTAISVTWNAAANAASYNVLRATSETGSYAKINADPVIGTSYSDAVEGTDPITYYWYKVVAVNAAAVSDPSAADRGYADNVVVVITTPPTGLAATQGSIAGGIGLSWDTLTGAASYNIYKTDSATGTPVFLVNTTSTSYQDPTAAGAVLYYTVSGTNSKGEGPQCERVSGFAMRVPGQVTGVSASDGGSTSLITISWNAVVADGTVRYRVYRDSTMIGDNVAETSITDARDASQDWSYSVEAFNAAGAGTRSASDTGYVDVSTVVVTASDGTVDNAVDISWTSAIGAVTYNVLRSDEANGDYTTLATLITGTTYTDNVLLGVYYYKVQAVGIHGAGDLSAADQGSPISDLPVPPDSVTASDGTAASIAVSWTAGVNADSYNVYRSTSEDTGYAQIASAIAVLNYTDADPALVYPTVYYYKVSSVNEHGESALSAADAGSIKNPCVPPVAPTGLGATTTEVSQITVTWGAVDGATSYNVFASATVGGTYEALASGVTGTSYTDSPVVGSKFYKVSAVGCAEGPQSGYVEGIGVPPCVPPAAPVVEAVPGDAQVALSWIAIEGATSYNVYSDGSLVTSVTGTSHTVTGLANGVEKCYTVSAVGCAEGAQSLAACATPAASGVNYVGGANNGWWRVIKTLNYDKSTGDLVNPNTIPDADMVYYNADGTITPSDPSMIDRADVPVDTTTFNPASYTEENRIDGTLGWIRNNVVAYYYAHVDTTGRLWMDRYAIVYSINMFVQCADESGPCFNEDTGIPLAYTVDGLLALQTTGGVPNNVTDQLCSLSVICALDTVVCDYELLPTTTTADPTAMKSGDKIDVSVYPIKRKSNGDASTPPRKDAAYWCPATTSTCTTVIDNPCGYFHITFMANADGSISLIGDPQRSTAKLIPATAAEVADVQNGPTKNGPKVCPLGTAPQREVDLCSMAAYTNGDTSAAMPARPIDTAVPQP